MKLVVLAGLIASLVSLLGTPVVIRFLRTRGYAQAIRESSDDIMYPEHGSKRGTPSMGGIALIAAVLAGFYGTHAIMWTPPTASGVLATVLMLGLGLVGMADDYLKIFKQRSTGMRARTKLLGQALAAVVFAAIGTQLPDDRGSMPISDAISWVRDLPLVLPTAGVVLWVWFIVTGITNGVNLTDGLDGLATGTAILTFAVYTIIGLWQFGQNCAYGLTANCYATRDPLDMGVFAAACAGACVGFLWWNASPARIFMGDTGSLAIGGAIAGLAIMTRTELLLALTGGLFVIVTLSVIAQVGSFKLTGRRVLRMAPLHHHFEMLGWPEILIVVRFWIMQGLFIAAALAIFYAEWVRQ